MVVSIEAGKRPQHEIHRVLIPQPMATQPYDYEFSPKPVLANGTRVQVTAFLNEDGAVVERWQFSETDVRWYRLEAYTHKRVTLKVEQRAAPG